MIEWLRPLKSWVWPSQSSSGQGAEEVPEPATETERAVKLPVDEPRDGTNADETR